MNLAAKLKEYRRVVQESSFRESSSTVRVGLFVRMEAKPGKEAEIENFLRSGLSLVDRRSDSTL
jgi:hypothetical protein